jgi:nitrile hydratase subunit alpha
MNERFKFPADREARNAARTKALESLLIEKGVITGETVDKVLGVFETKMGPFNGARLVARAWVDPAFKERLVADTPAAIAELDFPEGMAGAEGEHMRAVANAPGVHNLIVCTLCSCYPWPVLGLPPYWYNDPTFRARAVREPRTVLAEFGADRPIPERPSGTESMSETELAALVTPESMMGVAVPRAA